jgi:hypothetical protein
MPVNVYFINTGPNSAGAFPAGLLVGPRPKLAAPALPAAPNVSPPITPDFSGSHQPGSGLLDLSPNSDSGVLVDWAKFFNLSGQRNTSGEEFSGFPATITISDFSTEPQEIQLPFNNLVLRPNSPRNNPTNTFTLTEQSSPAGSPGQPVITIAGIHFCFVFSESETERKTTTITEGSLPDNHPVSAAKQLCHKLKKEIAELLFPPHLPNRKLKN